MLNTPLGSSAIVAFLVCFAACESSAPTFPSRTSQPAFAPAPAPTPPPPSPTPTPYPPISFPPLSGPSRTFVFASELEYPVTDHTKNSRFVLYDNGAFILQYLTISGGTSLGQYRDVNGVLMFLFEFQGRSVADTWDDATGILNGNSLTVRYDLVMQHSDFENAVYVLMR